MRLVVLRVKYEGMSAFRTQRECFRHTSSFRVVFLATMRPKDDKAWCNFLKKKVIV